MTKKEMKETASKLLHETTGISIEDARRLYDKMQVENAKNRTEAKENKK